jgi:transcriptional regulator with XRE-family HTH domain
MDSRIPIALGAALTGECSLYKLTRMETLGAYIRRVRDEQDISLREFAKRIGCTPPFVSDLEHGRRNPSEEVFAEIARVLGVSQEELRKRDMRAPIDEIKRVTQSDPKFAMAFRTVIDKKISADDLLRWAERHTSEKPKKK